MEGEQLWELIKIEVALENFWDDFFKERSNLLDFAQTQSQNFPRSFITEFLTGLEGWERRFDPGYEAARKSMLELALSRAKTNATTTLENRLKRKKEQERLKMARDQWELERIQSAMDSFWEAFGPGRSDLRAMAASQIHHFPPMFMSKFIDGLDGVKWSHRTDPDYELAKDIMGSLAVSLAKAPQPEVNNVKAETELDKEKEEVSIVEQDKEKEEATRMIAQKQKKRGQVQSKTEKQKEKQALFNKQEKERKKRETEKNNRARIGDKSIGLKK